MKNWYLCMLVTLVALLSILSSAPAQDDKEFARPVPGPEAMEKAMQVMMETGQPGKWHKRLQVMVGKWDFTTMLYMPGMPPTEGKGTAERTWLMEGRWLQERFQGEFMGESFEGFSLNGYDNYRKQYVSMWVDSMSTTMTVSRGSLDPSGNVLTQFAEVDEASTGEIGKMAKMITRFVSKDKMVFEMHDLAFGEGKTLVMEITYTRKK